MSQDWRVGFHRVMARCDLSPVERKIRRRIWRRTGRGPAGPSEKALERMRRRMAA